MTNSIDILAGEDIAASTRIEVAPYGALPGIPAEVEASAIGGMQGAGMVHLIHTRKSIAAFGDAASFTPLAEDRYRPSGDMAWSAVRQVNTFKQLITVTR